MAEEEEICTRISESVKMAGFLEKKGKMKIVSAWKKYWFVLEERLLLYYRSQIEYINLSPCRGSLNMGLVTTVRPGSSAGPCIIHVITRTQVVQLRAKNRAMQEEWLQALLDSMSLPLFTKTLKTHLLSDLHCHRYSMDNIPSHDRLRKAESERTDKLHQGFEYRKKDISDSFYGGSLDTVIWSKKFRSVRSPSPNIPKGKMLEKILGYVEEADTKSTSDMISLLDDDVSKGTLGFGKRKKDTGECSYEDPEEIDSEKEIEKNKQPLPVENENSEYYSVIKNERKSLSDNELCKTGALTGNEKLKATSREESQFERIKNAVKKTRDKAFKNKFELERKPTTVKKRRQSFLQKVFKRHYRIENEKEVEEYDSDTDDPLYDTIENVQEQKESLISSTSESSQEAKRELSTSQQGIAHHVDDERNGKNAESEAHAATTSHAMYTEIQKPIFGSKSILTEQAMSELKTKLKSRESIENQNVEFTKSKKMEAGDESNGGVKSEQTDENIVPDLPPRRRDTRPKSPWHDIPVNNSPVNAADANVSIRQPGVKFHDDAPIIFHQPQTNDLLVCPSEIENEEGQELKASEEKPGKRTDNDLTILLEQLTEITAGSLVQPHLIDLNDNTFNAISEESWEKSQNERRSSEPDYDIPRPHKLANLCISDGDNQTEDAHFIRKPEENSDTSSSFHSIEPDSLESAEKTFFLS